MSDLERMMKFISKTEDQCWEWTGAKNRKGYGRVFYKGRNCKAHRAIWNETNGPIDSSLVLDHLCRNRACVNPNHLRLVTAKVNALENSESNGAKNKHKTHCIWGHEFTPENTRINPKKQRVCRICRRARAKQYRARLSAASTGGAK